jgi:hypothetical protein
MYRAFPLNTQYEETNVAFQSHADTTAAVNSFLLSGCGMAPSNVWVNGGNAFGTVGMIGTTDEHEMEVRSGGNAVDAQGVALAAIQG